MTSSKLVGPGIVGLSTQFNHKNAKGSSVENDAQSSAL